MMLMMLVQNDELSSARRKTRSSPASHKAIAPPHGEGTRGIDVSVSVPSTSTRVPNIPAREQMPQQSADPLLEETPITDAAQRQPALPSPMVVRSLQPDLDEAGASNTPGRQAASQSPVPVGETSAASVARVKPNALYFAPVKEVDERGYESYHEEEEEHRATPIYFTCRTSVAEDRSARWAMHEQV